MQLETMYSTIAGGVATVVLNRPDVLNCANEQWARDLGVLADDLAPRECPSPPFGSPSFHAATRVLAAGITNAVQLLRH